jgi:4-amino-4-deoxy-L-arabinose transferase-like glycosyltransferase
MSGSASLAGLAEGRLTRRRAGLILLAVTLVGLAFRLFAWGHSLIGDELSTLWIVREFGLSGTVGEVSSDAEISPPLYFVLAWFATQLGSAPELVRLPALIAGTAAIPLSYLLGLRLSGRTAGLAAAAVMALSPFMVTFSATGRAYSLMVAMLICSTLAMLAAMRSGRARWWVLFALFTSLAMYSHYTAVYFLAAQLAWLLFVSPSSRIPGVLATGGAVLLYLPWVPSMLDDLDSPTLPILEAIQGTALSDKWLGVKQLLAGQPLIDPSNLALLLVAAGLVVLAVGLVTGARRKVGIEVSGPTPRQALALLLLLTFSTAICEALLALAGTDTFGARNLAATWAALPVLAGFAAAVATPALGITGAVLLLAGLAVGAVKVTDPDSASLDFKSAAAYIDREAAPGDVIYDATFVSPVPLTSLDAYLPQGRAEFRPRIPSDEPPFLLAAGPAGQDQEILDRALDSTGNRSLFVLTSREPVESGQEASLFTEEEGAVLPEGWEIVGTETFPGHLPLTVTEIRRR